MEAKDFYFQMSNDNKGETFFLITPRSVYDSEGCLSDESGIADEILPKGFFETMESTYEFDGNPESGRLLLIDLGMKEIDFQFGAGEPSTNSSDETEGGQDDFEEERDEYDDNDIDNLLKDDDNNENEPDPFDYKNVQTDKLIRHLKMMISTEAFEEAAKIKTELNSRDVIEF